MLVTSPVDICNLALLRINQNTIASMDAGPGDSTMAQFCRLVYDHARVSLLSVYNWTFAIRNERLDFAPGRLPIPPEPTENMTWEEREEQSAAVQAFLQEQAHHRTTRGFANEYLLPENYLRLISVRDPQGRTLVAQEGMEPVFALEGGRLWSNRTQLYMRFVGDVTEVSLFPPSFTECLVIDMAIRLTKKFNDSTTYLQQLQQESALTLSAAMANDCQQTMLSGIQSYPLLVSTWDFG